MVDQILEIIKSFKNNPLRKSEDRYKLASSIYSLTNYYNFNEILYFVEEMRGLNLKSEIDRQLFIDFFKTWILLEGVK